MDLAQLTEFFKWMTIINIALLLFSSIAVIALKDVAYKIHAKLFGIKPEHAAILVYGYLGMLKIMVIVFSIVPYLALLLI